jgi:hypothetical protein
MVGLQNAVIDGFAIPAALLGQHWDHTYVGSSCGLLWGCFGRSSGGVSVCSGAGSSIMADCLSQVGSRAGIRYGITGVCHQTSNRILYATRPQPATVHRCRGYQLSSYAYLDYGLGAWPEKLNCDPPTGGGGVGGSSMVLGLQLNDKDESGREIRALLENAHLGHSIEKSKFELLAKIHSQFRHVQAELVSSLQNEKISPEEYLNAFNSALRETMIQNERVLGHEDFLSVFGEAAQAPEGLIDRETFFSETRREPPKLRYR